MLWEVTFESTVIICLISDLPRAGSSFIMRMSTLQENVIHLPTDHPTVPPVLLSSCDDLGTFFSASPLVE